MIDRPGQLRVACIPSPHVQHAPLAEHPACLAPLGTTSLLVTRWRSQILTSEIRWIAYDPSEAHAALAAPTTKTFPIAVNGVLAPVVSPSDGPVVAIADRSAFGANSEVCDDLAGRILLCENWTSQQSKSYRRHIA